MTRFQPEMPTVTGRIQKTALVRWSGALIAIAGIAAPVMAQTPNHVKSITTTLVSSGAHKECFSLTTQQKLRYWYRADAPVDFNVQYVEDRTTQYPVKKDKTAIGSGTFQPKSAQDYCIVFTNASKRPVTLSFEYARVSN